MLRFLSGRGSRPHAEELPARTGLPNAVVMSAIDELVAAQRLRVADDGSLVLHQVPRAASPASGREDLVANQRWQHLLQVSHPADDVMIETVRGTQPTIDRIAALNLARPREILSVSPRPSGPLRPPVNDSMVALLQAGGTSVWITDQSRIGHAEWQPLIQRHLGHGERIYSVPAMQHRFLIFDRQVAIIPLNPANHGLGSLSVRSPALVQHLVTLFHEILGRATKVEADPSISHTWRTVLGLLASGDKDDTIARKLNISPRTVRRVVAGAMQDCDVESRFQLAVEAVRRGWLTGDLQRVSNLD